MRRVVFCADDLGVSRGTNEGIRRAADAGAVREASLCVTGLAAEEGAELARGLGGRLGVGLHLSLTLGRALTGRLRGLTGADGAFLPLGRVLRGCLGVGGVRPDGDEVAAEVDAQLARVRELGLEPTHVNGHHHVHCLPVVRDAVLDAARRHGVRWTRLPREHRAGGFCLTPRLLLLAGLGRSFGRAARGRGLEALPFLGLSLYDRGDYAARFWRAMGRLPAGSFEWMVHPRAEDPDFAVLDRLGEGRGQNAGRELLALSDPELCARLDRLGVQPVRFADL